MILGVDIETCSAADIEDGASPYAEHPSTKVWCVVFAFSTGPGHAEVLRWTPGLAVPARVVRHIEDGGPVLAHNVSFEQSIFHYILAPQFGFPEPKIEQWEDSLAVAAAFSLPLGLGHLGAVIGARTLKDDEGRKVMLSLSKVKRGAADGWVYPSPTPEQMARLLDYCEQDVLSMLDCWWKLPTLPDAERAMLVLDRKINTRGALLDLELAAAMGRMADAREQEIGFEAWTLTNDLLGMGNVPALTEWIKEQGVTLPKVVRKKVDGTFHATESIDRTSMAELLKRDDLPQVVRDALLMRIEAGRVTSLAKTARAPLAVNQDGRLRNALRFCKAHTGRWSSEVLQVHNLARPTKQFKAIGDLFEERVRAGDIVGAGMLHPVLDGLSFLLRRLVVAPKGRMLQGADFSAIEARVLAWIAGQNDVLAAFADPTRDVYMEDAAKVGSDNRDLGKEQRLGLGFGMGAVKFHARANARGVPLTLARAREVQQAWRKNNPLIVQFWHDLEAAVRAAIANRGDVFPVGEFITVAASKDCLRVRLPSGRALHYWRPSTKLVTKSVEVVNDAGEIETREFETEEIRFFMPKKRGMEIETTYSGKLTENVVQGIARDLLRDALLRLDAAGFEIPLHVHDSATAEVDAPRPAFNFIVAEVPAWAPGLAVAVEGYIGRHFKG